MAAGADSSDDMDRLRQGAMDRVITLAAITHNLMRALGTLASAFHARATTATIRGPGSSTSRPGSRAEPAA
jgi:hypothetical protein